jgi:hypothetical protein
VLFTSTSSPRGYEMNKLTHARLTDSPDCSAQGCLSSVHAIPLWRAHACLAGVLLLLSQTASSYPTIPRCDIFD